MLLIILISVDRKEPKKERTDGVKNLFINQQKQLTDQEKRIYFNERLAHFPQMVPLINRREEDEEQNSNNSSRDIFSKRETRLCSVIQWFDSKKMERLKRVCLKNKL